MASSEVQIQLRKPLPFLFDPEQKLYPIIIVVTICLLAVTTSMTTLGMLDPMPGLSPSSLTTTNERTDLIVVFLNKIGGLTQSLISVVWIIYHRGLIILIKKKIYKLQKGVRYDMKLSWFSKETYICYSLLVFATVSQGTAEIKTINILYPYVAFLINISFSFVVSGQLSILLRYLGSAYDSLFNLKNYESSVRWYHVLSELYDNVWMVYKLPVLLISTWNLGLTFTHLYLLFYPAFPGKIYLNIVYAMWNCLFFFPLLSIIRSCNYIYKKAEKFNEDMYWKMAKNKSLELLNNELLDFHITAHDEPIFTVCGFFSLDNSLICSIISQITTYLVIILQAAKRSEAIGEPQP